MHPRRDLGSPWDRSGRDYGRRQARTMRRWNSGVVAHGMAWAAAAVRVGSGAAVSTHVDAVGGMRCGMPTAI